MECPNGCKSPMKSTKVNKIFYRDNEPLVVSELVMNLCPDCGQETMPLSSARIIEEILEGRVKPSGEFIADLYDLGSIEKLTYSHE